MKHLMIIFLTLFGSEAFANGIKLNDKGILFDFPVPKRKITYNGKILKVTIPKVEQVAEISKIKAGSHPMIKKIDFTTNEKTASFIFHFPVEVKNFAKELHSMTDKNSMFLKVPVIRDLSKEKNVKTSIRKIKKPRLKTKTQLVETVYPSTEKTSALIAESQKKIIDEQREKAQPENEEKTAKNSSNESAEKDFHKKLKQYNLKNQRIMNEKDSEQMLSASLKKNDTNVDYKRYFGGIFVFFSILAIAVLFLKKSKKGSLLNFSGIKQDESKIKVEDTQIIGVKQKLMILSVDGERFLVCQTPQGCQLLSQIGNNDELSAGNSKKQASTKKKIASENKLKAKKRDSFANIIKDSSMGTDNVINQIRRKIDTIQEESFV